MVKLYHGYEIASSITACARQLLYFELCLSFLKKIVVDSQHTALIMCAALMGQQLRKRLKRQRREARNKRVQARLRSGMKK